MSDKFTRLEKLVEMKKQGLIDDSEFKEMKKEILGFGKLQIRALNDSYEQERLRIEEEEEEERRREEEEDEEDELWF